MSLRVLLVEDNAMNRELATDLLELEGYVVECAASGSELWALVADGTVPDVVLMDILLPDADGIALLGQLRAVHRFATVPVIALTAQALAGDESRFLATGFDAVITKPVDTRCFAAEVARIAGRRHEGGQ